MEKLSHASHLSSKIVFVFFSCQIVCCYAVGQCLNRDSLWNRLVFLRTSTIAPTEQLPELLRYKHAIQNCSYKGDSTNALLLQRIGVMYFRQGDYENAIQYTQQSININAATLAGYRVNYTDNIKNYSNLIAIYNAMGKSSEKMYAIDSCIAISKRYKLLTNFYLAALTVKIEHIFNAGDYLRCINDATVSETICMQYASLGGKDQYNEGLGYAFKCLTWKVNALRLTKKAELAGKVLEDDIGVFRNASNKELIGTIYSLLALVSKEKGDFPGAISYYKKSFDNNLKWNFRKSCSVALGNIGVLYFEKFKDYNKALDYYKRALPFADSTEALNIFDNIANVYTQKENFDSAFHYYQLAFDEIKHGINEKDLIRNYRESVTGNITEYVTGLVLDKGDAFLKRYKAKKEISDLGQAVSIYETADRIFDWVRLTQSDLQSKLFWKLHTRRLYENAVEACFISRNTSAAFHFFERSRAMVLNDQLAQQHWLGQKDIAEQSKLTKQILQKEKELAVTVAVSKVHNDIQNELYNNRQEIDKLEATIKSRNPLYYQNYIDSSSITIPVVREKLLINHQALVEIFSGDSAVYTIVITSRDARLSKIRKEAFDSLTNSFVSYMSSADLQNKDHNGLNHTSRDLYRLLFTDNPIPKGRIIISPEGRYFPFEALIVNESSQPARFLIEDHAVSYTYSARFLLNKFTDPALTATGNFMGIAPIQFAPNYHLASLTGSEQSVDRILTFFGNGHNLVSSKATLGKFMQSFGEYKVVQLYTHASDNSINKEPVIYFADSALYLSYLLPENKPATQLIVLSACETGNGQFYQGEGVFSFNRAFAALGIPASVSNLWSVDNGSTYRLTELFQENLSEGLATDIALQKAKLEFMNNKSKENELPFYWAAPILVGKTEIGSFNNKRNWNIWLLLISVIVLSGAIGFKILARKKRSVQVTMS